MSFLAVPGIVSGRSTAWTPADLSPEGWWRADLGHALSDTDPVTSWANQGGLSWTLAQGTSTYQPTYDAVHASFNNQAVLAFDGSDNLFLSTENWELASESSSLTVIVVCAQTTNNANQVMVQTTAYTGGGFRLRGGTGTSVPDGDLVEQGGVVSVIPLGLAMTASTVHAVALKLTGAATTSLDSADVYVDGVPDTADSADMTNAVANASTRSFIVGSHTTTGGSFNGQIAEVIFKKGILSAGDDASLTTYFNDRYGLSLSSGVTL